MNERIWKLGEVVDLPRKSNPLKKDGQNTYEHLTDSRYVCIREAENGLRGILVKMIGRVEEKDIMNIAGEPFCMDGKEESSGRNVYYSYPFPTLEELKEVLTIVRANDKLWQQLNDAGMLINPDGTFWIKEMKQKFFAKNKPQYYDPKTKFVETASEPEENHRRLTIVYF